MLQSFFGEHIDHLDLMDSRFLTVAVAVVVAATICYYAATKCSAAPNDGQAKGTKVPYLQSRVPLMGNALELMHNAERLHDWIAEKLVPQDGKPILLCLPGKDDMLITARPEHFEQILKTQFDNFPKSNHIHDVFFDLMGDGVVITNGDTWKRQRRVLVSLFSTRALREHMTPVAQKYAMLLREVLEDAVNSSKPLDVSTLMHRYTLDVFAEIGFGIEMGLLRSGGSLQPFEKAIEDAQYISADRFKQPLTLWKLKRWLNVGNERRMREAMGVIDEHIMGIVSGAIERRNHSPQEESSAVRKAVDRDVVSIILDGMDARNEPVKPEEVRDIAVAALIAGRDTTADALAWLFHVLSQNPRVEAKLRAELAAHVPKLCTDEHYVPSIDELQRVVYLEAVIRELLRLLPPGPLIATHCIRDTVFPDGTFVAKDTDIGLAFYSTARLTSVWGQDAATFVPERFLDKDSGKLISAPPPTKFCAFSAGPRVCVGQSLAFVEMKIVLASVVSRYHFSPDAQQKEVAYTQSITLGMKNPLLMRVEHVEPLAIVGVPAQSGFSTRIDTPEADKDMLTSSLGFEL